MTTIASPEGGSLTSRAEWEAWVAALRLLPAELTPPLRLEASEPSSPPQLVYPKIAGTIWKLERLPGDLADRRLRRLLERLALFHRRGLAHGDLQPEKLCETEDGLCLIEPVPPGYHRFLGISDAELRRKLRFGPPELAADAPVGPAGDVYRAAMIWYGLRTGNNPFAAADPVLEGAYHLARPLPPDPAFPPGSAAERLLRAMTARDPLERLADADAVLAVLDGAPIPRLPRPPRWQPGGLEAEETPAPGPTERAVYLALLLLVAFSLLVLLF